MAEDRDYRDRDDDRDEHGGDRRGGGDRGGDRRGSRGGRGRGRGGRRFGRRKVCRFKEAGVTYIDWKDYRMLKQFVTDEGKIVPRRTTGTSAKYQRQLTQAVKRARFMALLPMAAEHNTPS